MQRIVLKSKIHRATITDANLNYVGSLTIDKDLMDAADLVPYEQVQVLNINNGHRLETYVIEGERGSGKIELNGAAARLGHTGDLIIIVSYVFLDENEVRQFVPKIVHVDSNNRIVE